MSFVWDDYLQLAIELRGSVTAQDPLGEAKLRSSISRAYYAVFCKAKAYLTINEPQISISQHGSAHAEVRNAFNSSRDQNRRYIGIRLDRLRQERNIADYNENASILLRTADSAIRNAQQALAAIQNI